MAADKRRRAGGWKWLIGQATNAVKYPAAMTAWYGLFCLLLCYFMYFVDRNILTLLVAPVRKDLGINDTQMGILNGYSFSVLNGLFTIPFGWYCDRKSRSNVLVFGITLWGCSTIASGFTTTFTAAHAHAHGSRPRRSGAVAGRLLADLGLFPESESAAPRSAFTASAGSAASACRI